MGGLTCNACNREFEDDAEQKLHYRSEWHRYNLKRKVAGVPGVTESLFQARQLALAEEHEKTSEAPMLYCCALCGKEYRSSKAHSQHLKSRMHTMKASQESTQMASITIIKPLTDRLPTKSASISKIPTLGEGNDEENDESEDSEWEEVDPNEAMEEASESLTRLHVNGITSSSGFVKSEAMDEDEELDVSCCFICDRKHDGIERCMVHMHKEHGFFIPDVEYLNDPTGLLTYVGLKVKRDFTCLYCNERCQPFQSLEAVRKHMIAKGHCKLRYGDGGDDEDGDLEDFYDYSSSYTDKDGKQLVALGGDSSRSVELGSGGAELIITQKTENGTTVRIFGSREFLRYYRQKPRPSRDSNIELAISLASRYRSMGLATNPNSVRMKILKEMNRSGVDAMRTKIGMKSNVIRNLPKNVPY
ncbi:cytoplasmic 60S subunit biogenesis factor REI1 homolog 1-like [Phalaenopsis equestris]|uniref:cytoplasmic 60S subunit biogenesis factor REI1 homolog 1-like n=1 Tax=Phalaenopsis equestris TaxID=78828 RepID=UPI0009E20855|nr:cytoplasmic 60S subunit biogenesis factor REI1 homolog 1-like [Phalaenopsis equestris]